MLQGYLAAFMRKIHHGGLPGLVQFGLCGGGGRLCVVRNVQSCRACRGGGLDMLD